LSRRFSTAAGAFATAEQIDAHDATDHIADRLRSWIAECLCDAIAVHQLGPTYLYSFIAEVVAGSLDEAAPRHPPPRQRIRHLVAQLDRLGWTDVMASADGPLDEWVRELISVKPAYTGVAGFLSWAVDDLRAVIRTAAEGLLRHRIFRPDPDELTEVAALLSAKVPPAQRHSREAVSPESIMLCCWHAALAGAGGGATALATAPDAEELADVLPAALELSALVSSWS
jgi:hypothetical protein